jgi:hypothetical protein
MSEHSVMRRRLEAVNAAIEAMKGWGTGESAGPIDIYSNRLAVDAEEYEDEEAGVEGTWVNAAGLYQMLLALRGEVAEMAEHVEAFAAEHGPVTWENLPSPNSEEASE